MTQPFLTPVTNVKPSQVIETPYLKARQAWDERMGDAIIRAKNWRLAFFAQALLSCILAGAIIVQITQRRVIPVLVGLDKERGEPTVLGPVKESNYTPGPVELKYFLSQFIRFVRSVPADQVVIKQNWLRAYAFLRKDAAGLLNEQTNNNPDSPLKKIGKFVVNVQPLSIVAIPATDSYQVRWKETVYSAQGMKTDEYTMLGTFSVELDPPKDEQTLHENPLGLFIRTFQWNREL